MMSGSKGDIRISKPRVENVGSNARLCADVVLGNDTSCIWFEVPSEYGQFLCQERADAFVIGLLPYAMRKGYDIICEAPVGEQLLFQLRTYLIPSLARNSHKIYETRISAPIDSKVIQNAGGVGAGISCGVDSMHVLKNFLNPEYPSLKLSHLVLNQVGAFGDNQYYWTVKHASRLCQEMGIRLIQTNSNIAQVYDVSFIHVHTFVNCFAVYALQKLWNVFYYGSSGIDFQQSFSLKDSENSDAAYYDLLSLDSFSTRTLKIYSEGGAISRFEKIVALQDFTPAQNYLQVCVNETGGNCGRCFKCVRTLLILEAIGALDKFQSVFDISYYRANRRWYLKELYFFNRIAKDKMLDVAYEKLKAEISLLMKVEVRIQILRCYIKNGFKRILK